MDRVTLALWLDLLRCQAELTLPLELPYYHSCADWSAASAVLDLGTGPGYYLRRLAELFPEKSYLGIDIEEDYIEAARDGAPDQARFMVSDLFKFVGQYPVVMARLVAQHLPSLDAFLNKVSDLLTPGGCFLSVEPEDSLRLYYPPLPKISGMFRDFKQVQRDKGHDRDAGGIIAGLAPSCGMRLERLVEVIVPSSLPNYKGLFVCFHKLIFDLFSGPFGMSLERAALEEEITSWAEDPRSYAQLGVYFAIYRKS
jgi:SAM-dependent methyltransferase